VEEVAAGRITLEAARESILLPECVLAKWAEVADRELRIIFAEAAVFRLVCALKFLEFLGKPAKIRQPKVIVRKQWAHGARLPVASEGKPEKRAGSQYEPRSQAASL